MTAIGVFLRTLSIESCLYAVATRRSRRRTGEVGGTLSSLILGHWSDYYYVPKGRGRHQTSLALHERTRPPRTVPVAQDQDAGAHSRLAQPLALRRRSTRPRPVAAPIAVSVPEKYM